LEVLYMKLAKELVVTTKFLIFWFLYSFLLWYSKGYKWDFRVLALMGLAVIDTYLIIQVIRHEIKRRSQKSFTHIKLEKFRPSSIKEESRKPTPRRLISLEGKLDGYEGFRNLFSDNPHGGGAL
jgi:hypothetical protein